MHGTSWGAEISAEVIVQQHISTKGIDATEQKLGFWGVEGFTELVMEGVFKRNQPKDKLQNTRGDPKWVWNKSPEISQISNNPVFRHKPTPYTEGDKCCKPHELGSPPYRSKCFRVTFALLPATERQRPSSLLPRKAT